MHPAAAPQTPCRRPGALAGAADLPRGSLAGAEPAPAQVGTARGDGPSCPQQGHESRPQGLQGDTCQHTEGLRPAGPTAPRRTPAPEDSHPWRTPAPGRLPQRHPPQAHPGHRPSVLTSRRTGWLSLERAKQRCTALSGNGAAPGDFFWKARTPDKGHGWRLTGLWVRGRMAAQPDPALGQTGKAAACGGCSLRPAQPAETPGCISSSSPKAPSSARGAVQTPGRSDLRSGPRHRLPAQGRPFPSSPVLP